MRERLALVLCLGSLLGVASDAGANWPMPRANIRRTGVADGTLGVSLPAVRWKRYLGGGAPDDAFEWFVAAPVGYNDVVYLAASDRLEARRPDSTLLWQTPLDGVRTVTQPDLQSATDAFVQQQVDSNQDFQIVREPQQIDFGGQEGYYAVISGPSAINGVVEIDETYTTVTADGRMFYIITIAPEDEAGVYRQAFEKIIRSLRLER